MQIGRWLAATVASLTLLGASGHVLSAQLGDSSFERLDHPAIQYSTRAARDPAAALGQRIRDGSVQLSFDAPRGYLRSVLDALDIPVESQVVVFSKTSTQLNLINPRNPRAVYFNDTVSVGWIPGTFVLEIAAQDPELGTIFYEIDQQPAGLPDVRRTRACLRCHHSLFTDGVPGRLMRSTPTAADGTPTAWTRNLAMDHRTPFDQRWGGWYVTGRTSGLSHMGNAFAAGAPAVAPGPSLELSTLEGRFDTQAFLSPYSDVVALMVLEHQSHLTNLLTRLSWETRASAYETQAGSAASERAGPGRPPFAVPAAVNALVDYLLFVDEAPLSGRIQGTSGFAEQFVKRGPFDRRGRSLRDLDLERRLLRYPCSYLIYSPAFDALPAAVRDAVYQRMWQVLGGADRSGKYARLSDADRRAIIEILRDTKRGLPDYFRS